MANPILENQIQQGTQAPLAAHAEVSISPPVWSYTVFNDEMNSTNFIKLFQLDVKAPFTVTGTPAGWSFDTDGNSYVLWFNAEEGLPYPSDVAPGALLGGFEIQSVASLSAPAVAGLFGWDHSADTASLATFIDSRVPFISQVQAQSSGLVYNRATRAFYGMIKLTNIGSHVIVGPIQMVLNDWYLNPGATLVSASGSLYDGSPYQTVSFTTLAPGGSVSVPIQITYTNKARLSYTVQAFSNDFNLPL